MGDRTGPIHLMAWQRSLGEMLEHGTRVRQRCPTCATWEAVDLEAMARFRGRAYALWDRHPPCGKCGTPTNFHASPGDSSPFRPLFG